ncbi:hypothetical protein CHI07_08250 [Paenibacillus sp. 7884-2]|nr:hypothetical protein CHI07_08250 [Paenibacillus sp. 7884-2]
MKLKSKLTKGIKGLIKSVVFLFKLLPQFGPINGIILNFIVSIKIPLDNAKSKGAKIRIFFTNVATLF